MESHANKNHLLRPYMWILRDKNVRTQIRAQTIYNVLKRVKWKERDEKS
jgi:hypothetical protein